MLAHATRRILVRFSVVASCSGHILSSWPPLVSHFLDGARSKSRVSKAPVPFQKTVSDDKPKRDSPVGVC